MKKKKGGGGGGSELEQDRARGTDDEIVRWRERERGGGRRDR